MRVQFYALSIFGVAMWCLIFMRLQGGFVDMKENTVKLVRSFRSTRAHEQSEETLDELSEPNILIYVTTHMSENHLTALRYCWPRIDGLTSRTGLMGKADILFFTTSPPPKDVIQMLGPTRVHIETYVNPGYQEGATLAITEAIRNNWFDGYDWVIRINPDVIIRNDSWLLRTMNDTSVDAIFADCFSRTCTQRCTSNQVHTDFFAIRPSVLPSAWEPPNSGAERAFATIAAPIIRTGRDRWLPFQTQRSICRVKGPFVIHDHSYVETCRPAPPKKYFFLYSEPRCYAAIPHVIKNALSQYNYSLVFLYSDENKDCLHSIIKNDPTLQHWFNNERIITVYEKTMDSSHPIYNPTSWNNKLYTSESFWTSMKKYGNYAITVQSDTLICKNEMPDLDVDFIGGISYISPSPSSDTFKKMLNGGLSIRNIDWCIKCIRSNTRDHVEDSLFNKCPRKPVSVVTALSFASDNGTTKCFTWKNKRICPWGVHKPWKSMKQYKELENNCPGLKTLQSLQKQIVVPTNNNEQTPSTHKKLRCLPIDTTGNHKKMVIPSVKDKRRCLIESPMSERVSKLCDSVLGEPMANASYKLMFGDIHLHKNEYTMVGVQRLKNFAASISEVNREKIPGAIVELGVWRGGGMMVASAINIESIEQRELYLFDAFESIPGYGSDNFVKYLQVDESFVKDGFLKFGVMNEHVHFRKGLFQDTVPSWNKQDKIAILRVDGNFYDSYQDAMYYMYESVPVGGIIIFDDVMSHVSVMRFWKDFKKEQGLGEDLNRIDTHSAWFRKENDVVLDWKYFRAPQKERGQDINHKGPCPVHIRECHPSWPKRPVSTKTYHSSAWEQLWLDNIKQWQNYSICEALSEQNEQLQMFMKDTCSASTNTDWCLIDDSVHRVWYNTKNGQVTSRKPASITTISQLEKMTPKDETIWSYFELSDGTREYIEPLVSHLRHPLAQCSFGSTFLIDRSYVLPGKPGKSKTFLFDAGASHWSQGAGGPSLSYFASVWKRYGFNWTHIEGWEGGTTVAKFQASVPQEWRSRTHFHKEWISTSPNKQPFVPDVIRATVSKEDYVVFKLDIDSKSVETAIVDYMLSHPDTLRYIDEFIWEQHVDNYLMAGNWGNSQDMSKTIYDSYQYFLKLRKLGVRAHSWV